MAPSLEQIFTIRLLRNRPTELTLGATKGSAPRYIVPLVSGSLQSVQTPSSSASPLFSAPVNAALQPGGSDWLRADPSTGTGHLEARMQFRDAETGAVYGLTFNGIVRINDRIQKVLGWSPEAETTRRGEDYNFTAPVWEVSREEDRWMEQTAWVGHGQYVVDRDADGEMSVTVEYAVYRLVTG